MLTYPHINPIAISIGPILGVGPLRVHWYGIMYLIGFVAAWWLARYRARRPGSTWSALDIDDLIFYSAIGVIVGGRVGWCIFYGHDVIAENWLNVFHIWDGGMSFHGGMTGVLAAGCIFARGKRKKDVPKALAAYKRLNQLAMQVIADDGILVSCSCSYHVSAEELQDAIAKAARSADRHLQILEAGGQAPDHPVHPAIPETRYLKSYFCRVNDTLK